MSCPVTNGDCPTRSEVLAKQWPRSTINVGPCIWASLCCTLTSLATGKPNLPSGLARAKAVQGTRARCLSLAYRAALGSVALCQADWDGDLSDNRPGHMRLWGNVPCHHHCTRERGGTSLVLIGRAVKVTNWNRWMHSFEYKYLSKHDPFGPVLISPLTGLVTTRGFFGAGALLAREGTQTTERRVRVTMSRFAVQRWLGVGASK